MDKLEKKIKLYVALGMAILFGTGSLILLLFVGIGAGGSTVAPIQTAPENRKAEAYARIATDFCVPWELALLTDSTLNDSDTLDSLNPLYTILEFTILTVNTEEYKTIKTETNADGTQTITEAWEVIASQSYAGKKEILNYISAADVSEELTSESIKQSAAETAAAENTEKIRYSIEFSCDIDIKRVLENMGIDEEKKEIIKQTYEADYENALFDKETVSRLNSLQSACGLYQYIGTKTVDYVPQITFVDSGTAKTVYYNQLATEWINQKYGKDRIGSHGAAVTTLAMVIATFTDNSLITPAYMAEWAYTNGYWRKSCGSFTQIVPAALMDFNLKYSLPTSENEILADLQNGDIIIALMRSGRVTEFSHYVIFIGVTADSKIIVADPADSSGTYVMDMPHLLDKNIRLWAIKK